jgi:hypothetical protein
MDASLSNVVTIVGLLIASIVACFRAFEEIFKQKAAAVYTILAGASVALLAVYADKIVVK